MIVRRRREPVLNGSPIVSETAEADPAAYHPAEWDRIIGNDLLEHCAPEPDFL